MDIVPIRAWFCWIQIESVWGKAYYLSDRADNDRFEFWTEEAMNNTIKQAELKEGEYKKKLTRKECPCCFREGYAWIIERKEEQ